MNPPAPYIAELHDAQEVTLVATADLGFWRDQLQEENLFPHDRHGQAELLISAVSSRYRGVKFKELSIGAFVSDRPDGTSRDGFYLASAFNTSRLFSFIERFCFQTPYRHARIEIGAQSSPSFKLIAGAVTLLHAEKSAVSSAARTSQETWEGRIYLPRCRTRKSAQGKLFFARISGHTEAYSFAPASDIFALNPNGPAAIRWLLESQASGVEWHIRRQATHARSKTYDRPH